MPERTCHKFSSRPHIGRKETPTLFEWGGGGNVILPNALEKIAQVSANRKAAAEKKSIMLGKKEYNA